MAKQLSLFARRQAPKLRQRKPPRPSARLVERDPTWIFAFVAPRGAEWRAIAAGLGVAP